MLPYLNYLPFKDALSGLRQFLATENSLRMIKNAFYFTLKALFVTRYLNFCLDFLVMWKNGLIRRPNLVNKQLQYKYWLISQLVKSTSQWNYSQTLSWTIKIEHISGSVAYNFKYFVFIVWKVVDYRHVLKRGCRPFALTSYKAF